MSVISASLVKKLRDQTGAGMMDCKKALIETEGDVEGAIDWLRKQGIAKAEKKSGRTTSEGVVITAADGNAGAILEINCETDFVARNEQFMDFARNCVAIALKNKCDLATLLSSDYSGSSESTVEEQLRQLSSTLGENMSIARCSTISVEQGFVAQYTHNAIANNIGQMGVLLSVETSQPDNGDAANIARQIAMHIAAANPAAVNEGDLDADIVEREKNVLREQALASGKPAEIVEKMLVGRMKKFYAESVLLQQPFVMDDSMNVEKALQNSSKSIGAEIKLSQFKRWLVGSS